MIKCIECNVSASKKTLHRTTPKGNINAGWMCKECIIKYHDKSLIDEEVEKITDIIKGELMKLTGRFFHKKGNEGMILYVEVEKVRRDYPGGAPISELEYVQADEELATRLAVMLINKGGVK